LLDGDLEHQDQKVEHKKMKNGVSVRWWNWSSARAVSRQPGDGTGALDVSEYFRRERKEQRVS